MRWMYERVIVTDEPAWRVYNDDNDVEFMCSDDTRAARLKWSLQNGTLDMHVPGYGYEKEEFRTWKEAQNADTKPRRQAV